MTTTELRKQISESREPEWYNSVEVTINYPHINFTQNLYGLSSIHQFLSQQANGWEKYESLPDELNQSKRHFTNLRTRIENFFTSYHSQNENVLNSNWRNEKNQLQKTLLR